MFLKTVVMSKSNNVNYKLAIEFGNWLSKNGRCADIEVKSNIPGFSKLDWNNPFDQYPPDFTDFKTTEELFQEFLKEYNG